MNKKISAAFVSAAFLAACGQTSLPPETPPEVPSSIQPGAVTEEMFRHTVFAREYDDAAQSLHYHQSYTVELPHDLFTSIGDMFSVDTYVTYTQSVQNQSGETITVTSDPYGLDDRPNEDILGIFESTANRQLAYNSATSTIALQSSEGQTINYTCGLTIGEPQPPRVIDGVSTIERVDIITCDLP